MDEQLEGQIKKILFKHLDQGEYDIFVFGSRASASVQRYSDIDIGVQGKQKLPAGVKLKIEEEFEQSDIPYRVDIVDFTQISDKFRRIAQKHKLKIN